MALIDLFEKCTPSDFEVNAQTKQQAEKLKGDVRKMLLAVTDSLQELNLINQIQRLGFAYHFEKEIKNALQRIYNAHIDGKNDGDDLHAVALQFQLLRREGYNISSDVFKKFQDENHEFKATLKDDYRGLLSLYGAAYLATPEEDILDKALTFTRKHLRFAVPHLESPFSTLVVLELDVPLYKYVERLRLRYYISIYQQEKDKDDVLLEFAKLDFNTVQALHKKEMSEISRWWRDLGLAKELTFVRDQPLKWYMWSLAALSNIQLSKYRIELTKPISLIYVIDDIFDVYGTVNELACFTEAVDRWELSNIDMLPRYMQICYVALYNITNEFSHLVHKDYGWNPIHSLRKVWADLCKAFLVEAKWFASGHVPKADEYLRNGVVSTGVPVVLVHIFYLLGHDITQESADCVDNIPGLISCPATILRLWDDLGSAKDENQEGKDGSYVECYMKEHGITSPSIARQHVMNLISMEWKKLNKECISSSHFSPSFKEASLNAARMVQIMYSYDHNQRLPVLEEQIHSLLIESIPV